MNVLDPDKLAQLLGISRKSLIDTYSKQPGFPQSITGRKKPRWLEEAVLDFLRAKSVHSSHSDAVPQ